MCTGCLRELLHCVCLSFTWLGTTICYCLGGLYNLNMRELQTTETELRCTAVSKGLIGYCQSHLRQGHGKGSPYRTEADVPERVKNTCCDWECREVIRQCPQLASLGQLRRGPSLGIDTYKVEFHPPEHRGR
jgi:hypothetical protein